MRKPIFDTIRAQRGRGFTADEVSAIDALLDRLGIEKDNGAGAPVAPTPTPVTTTTTDSANPPGLENPQAFFDSLRQAQFMGSSLKPDQISGLQAVLAAAKDANWPLAFAAYALATACHETAYTMQPVREAFWLSENWRKTHLRYFPYYGRGYVQLTWKANYDKADQELGLGGRLSQNLDLAMDPDIAAKIMAKGMEEGWFCADRNGNRHTLARHVPSDGSPATLEQFTSARRIINGLDKASKIAGEALKFQAALRAGGW